MGCPNFIIPQKKKILNYSKVLLNVWVKRLFEHYFDRGEHSDRIGIDSFVVLVL
jgi:hypothetical protein